MKCIFSRFNMPTAFAIAGLFFCLTVIPAIPAISQTQADTSAEKAKQSKVQRTEAKIKDYHSQLKITPAQEDQWNKVAQVMRENAQTMESLIEQRRAQGSSMNAVDDLKSYSRMMDAHAAGLRKFITAFEPLYNSMSPEQKKNADTIFTEHSQKKGQKKK